MVGEVTCYALDGSVGHELQKLFQPESHAFALVRAWDSQRRPDLIVKALLRLGIPSRALPAGALVDLGKAGPAALAAALFGFDELWVGSEETDWGALESVPPMTSDGVDFRRDDCAPFRDALRDAAASLALADGCGVNVVRVGPSRIA